jgi:multimeric flavodoxin WrbA
VDLPSLRLDSPDGGEARFQSLLGDLREAAAVVWVLGTYAMGVPSSLKHLFDRLFEFAGSDDFRGRPAATILASARYMDDRVLELVRRVSEELGFAFVGEVSAIGNPISGYEEAREIEAETSRLARSIGDAVRTGYVSAPRHPPVDRAFLRPVPGPSRPGTDPLAGRALPEPGGILVLAGTCPLDDPDTSRAIGIIRRSATRPVEVVDLSVARLKACDGCYLCNRRVEGTCVQRDDLAALRERMHRASGIVVVSRGASAMPDLSIRRMFERMWGDCHRPSFQGRQGLAVVLGAGPMTPMVVEEMALFLRLVGVETVGVVTDSVAALTEPAMEQAVRQLEQAVDEGLTGRPRFLVEASRIAFRDIAVRWSFFLRADYEWHRGHGLLAGAPRWRQFFMRRLVTSRGIERFLYKWGGIRADKRRARRLIEALERDA